MIGGIQKHDLTHSPTALYQFNNGDMSDSSGNNLDLSTAIGTPRWGSMAPGLEGIYFDNASQLWEPTGSALLRATGALTISVILWNHLIDTDFDNHQILAHGNPGTDSDPDNNILYSLVYTFEEMHWRATHESGAGTNRTITFDSGMAGRSHIEHVSFTRESDGRTSRVYVNGLQMGNEYVYGAAPSGGSNGNLFVGGSVNISTGDIRYRGGMTSLKITVGRSLSDAEALAEFQRTIGQSAYATRIAA